MVSFFHASNVARIQGRCLFGTNWMRWRNVLSESNGILAISKSVWKFYSNNRGIFWSSPSVSSGFFACITSYAFTQLPCRKRPANSGVTHCNFLSQMRPIQGGTYLSKYDNVQTSYRKRTRESVLRDSRLPIDTLMKG